MPRRRKPSSRPLVPPLDLVLAALKDTSLSAKQDGDSVIVGHQNFTSRIDIVPPTNRESANFPIKVVVQVKTELPEKLEAMFAKKPEMTAAMNAMATLGALTIDSGQIFVGSRLTIYEDAENLLKLHVALILCAATGATDSLLGAMRRTFAGEGGKEEESLWSADDMDEVSEYLISEMRLHYRRAWIDCRISSAGWGRQCRNGRSRNCPMATARRPTTS